MYKLETSSASVTASIDKSQPVFCDTETVGLYGSVRLLQIHQAHFDKPIVIDAAYTSDEDFKEIVAFLQTCHLVFHNATYDLKVLDIIPDKLDDTLYLAKLAFPSLAVEELAELRGFGLDKVCYKLGLSTLYEGLKKSVLQRSKYNFGLTLTEDQYRYAATDVIALEKVYSYVKGHKDNQSYQLDILSMQYAMHYCKNGISVDQKAVNEEILKLQEQLDANIPKLEGLNVNSSAQCKKALGTSSSNKEVLLDLIYKGNDLAKLIYEHRRLLKRLTMLKSYNYPKVYSVFNVAGASTGRFTATGKNIYAGINAQQIPRDLKRLFYNTNKGMVTIEADYSTLELRLAATIFGDNVMADQLRQGKDLHTELAKLLANKSEITKEERFRAKAANFGFIYGMSATSFKSYAFLNYGLTLTLEEATQWRNKYFSRYKTIAKYHDMVWKNYKNASFLQYTALDKTVKPKLGTDAINAPVQGTGAECTKLAIHRLVKRDKNYLNYIVNVVHDSIKLEVPVELEEKSKRDLEECMLEAWDNISVTNLFKFKDIPMLVDIEVKYGQD